LTIASLAPTTLNPALNPDAAPEEWYADLAYEPLMVLAKSGLKLSPGLAVKWGFIGTGNKVFQMTLRSGVEFSNGQKLTAKGVVAFLKYFEKNGVSGTEFFGGSTITATGPLTVRIHLAVADADLPLRFANYANNSEWVIAPAGIAHPKSLGNVTLGAGPYVLDSKASVSNSTYVYTANKRFFDQAAIHWNKIIVKVVGDESSTLAALESGQVQVAEGSTTDAAAAKSAGLSVVGVPVGAYGIIVTDPTGSIVPALGNLEVREALAYAIDRPAIAQAVFGSYATSPGQVADKAIPGYLPSLDKAFAYNPTKAKQLLTEAGYPNGFSLTLLTSPQIGLATMMQAVASDWAAIGVTLTIDNPGQATWLNQFLTVQYPLSALGLSYSLTPDLVSQFFSPNSAEDNGKYPFTTLTQLWNRYNTAPVGSKASVAVQTKMNQYLTNQVMWIFVASPDFMWFVRPGVAGISANPAWPISDPVDWYSTK
jgi:peptide/nickel transport system substrate-binding protein